ncbi:PcfJ domain-containing protein [Brevibacillus porteri]|uniref:PcfJ domain-containing protein n=1 Tax=Brevibacillus porteri TaxID=2126350 RepID=UPI0036254B3E
MLNNKEKIDELKNQIRSSNFESYQYIGSRSKKLIGTMYVKQKMDYGFHIYYIHEPSETDPLAGKNGTISEMFYDLRNKKYWIKRNLKDVNFSVRNVDSIFPKDYDQRVEIFNLLSTKANQGLYNSALHFLGAMGKEQSEMFGRFFHRLITEYSYFELLYKAGIKIDSNTYVKNPNGKSPMEILGLSKTQWKMTNKYKLSIGTFNKLSNDTADQQLINYLDYIKTLEQEYGLEKVQEFLSNEKSYLYGEHVYRSRPAIEIAKRYNLPIKHFIRYIYFECDVSQGLNAYAALSDYADYIRMTTEMGYERFDRYPRFLRTAHDIASRNYKIKLNEEEMKEWETSYQINKQYEYSYQGYKIFPPKDPSDLIKEGNVLGHCVGSYVNKVRKGTSVILFLREREDVESPLVTIEVKGNCIAQARGKMNNPPSNEQNVIIKKFAEKYQLAI